MKRQETSLAKNFGASALNLVLIFLLLGGAITGLVLTAFNPLWIAGSLGISAAAANQIVRAIKAGRSAATVIGGVLGGGVASALTATITWMIFHFATEIAVS